MFGAKAFGQLDVSPNKPITVLSLPQLMFPVQLI
jgi:hypothetical protein